LQAFHAAMRRHGLETPAAHVAGGRWTLEKGRDATRRILATDEPPTALVSSSVELALGALQACRELEVAIPDALALATFDDAYFADLLDPPLTAVAYDPSDVGAQAASLLVEAIREDAAQPREVTIPVNLVARRSCGCTQ
jgi:LacI family transcriptional regulator